MRNLRTTSLLCLLIGCIWHVAALGQTPKKSVRIIHADSWEHDPRISSAQRLLGAVHLEFQNTTMFCDSAYLFANEDIDAYGNIRIQRGDSLRMSGESLHYAHSLSKLEFRDNIFLRNKQMTLKTDHLDYLIHLDEAVFFGGAKITSLENDNVLESQEGIYFTKTDVSYFRSDVVLRNSEVTVRSDTLHYFNQSETAHFYGPTTIKGERADIYCENGWFNSRSQICQFNKNARVISGNHQLSGDSIYYDALKGYGEVFRNVAIHDTTSNFIIEGEYGWHSELSEKTFVTDKARLVQIFGQDSLFLHADTLRAEPDSSGHKRLKAFHHVRFFKTDMQGIADSMCYIAHDSLLQLIGAPMVWSDESQISGNLISLKIYDGRIESLHIPKNAFIISKADSTHFNQIKGKSLTGYFTENTLSRIWVQGNGQTIYFPSQENDPHKLMGMNRAECSELMINISGNEIEKIVFHKKPDGVLLPNSEYTPSETQLEDFLWTPEKRPMSKASIFEE